MSDQIVELSSAYRARAARLRLQARVANIERLQPLLLLAEEYAFRAERIERRCAELRGGLPPAVEAPVVQRTAAE